MRRRVICAHLFPMSQSSMSKQNDVVMRSANIAERFRAHARLCRQIASRCCDEEIAHQLEQLAQQCLRAAGHDDSAPSWH
jgi:hypothetical protein